MKNSLLKRINWKFLTASILAASVCSQTQAAPMPIGTHLGIEQGVGAGSNVPCSSGSCFGMEVAPGLIVWTDFGSGTDGGIVIGKNQASGGQETGPTPTDNPANATPGELTTAWNFFSNFGTFHTPTGSTNVFDDASCAGAGCIGKTELNSWNVAWNGNSVQVGSSDGCNSPVCSADQLAGIFVSDYTITPSTTDIGLAYTMKYDNVIADGDPSSFGNVKFSLMLKGKTDCGYLSSPFVTLDLETVEGMAVNWRIPRYGVCGIGSNPTNGELTVTSTDGCQGIYTPNPNYIGQDSFSFGFRTEVGSKYCPFFFVNGDGVANINVLPGTGPTPTPTPTPPLVNNPPIAYDLTVFIPYALSVTWTPNVIDPDGHAIFCDVSQPPPDNYNTTVTIEPDCSSGTISSLVPIDSCHKTSFTYSAHDQYGAYSNQATVTVDIDKGCGYFEPTPTPTPPPTPTPTMFCDTAIYNYAVFAEGQVGKLISWEPDILAIGISTCWIHTAPASGTATVAEDCSSGTFVADQPGVYTFYYDSELRPDIDCYVLGDTGPGIVTVTVNESSTPIAEDLSITNASGTTTEVSTGYTAWIGTCGIETQPLNGVAVMGDLCSSIKYTSNAGFSGSDSFQYFLQDKSGKHIGNVSVSVSPSTCESLYPQTEVTMIGKGKNLEVEETMTTTFKGNIVSTDEAKGKVTICRGSTVSYEVTSTVGTANCTVKHGVSAESTGTLTDKGKLVCTNKPDGKDTDKFKIKRSKKKGAEKERRWFR